MNTNLNSHFEQIAKNNGIVDQMIDALVNQALERSSECRPSQETELEKTSRLLMLSSLILGDSENREEKDGSY